MILRDLIKDTFKNSKIPEDITDLKMGDLTEWDSLGNFNLILAVEKHFDIQFDISDIENINSVKALQIRIDNSVQKK
jgi:acyl carrier protein